jgi:glucose/arabinose dehydrogenase
VRQATAITLFLAALAALASIAAPAQGATGVRLERVASFKVPVQLAAPPGDRRLFVAERGGRIRVVRRGRVQRTPFLDLSRQVEIRSESETEDHGGLLAFAFSPRYRRDGLVYALYTHTEGRLRLESFRRGPSVERARPGSGRVLLSVGREPGGGYALGGDVAFGPDRLLYASFGFQGKREVSQDLGRLEGKLVRIDPGPAGAAPYAIPAGNPFASRPGARAEIFAVGLRNAFRFSFTRTGDVVLGDVGESHREEIDVLRRSQARRGLNFGWDLLEGTRRMAPGPPGGAVAPAIELSHSRGYCSVIGGRVVRDRRLRGLLGRYVYSDLCYGRLRSTRLVRGRARGDRAERASVSGPVAFGEDSKRRLYVVSLRGPVYRLDPR